MASTSQGFNTLLFLFHHPILTVLIAAAMIIPTIWLSKTKSRGMKILNTAILTGALGSFFYIGEREISQKEIEDLRKKQCVSESHNTRKTFDELYTMRAGKMKWKDSLDVFFEEESCAEENRLKGGSK